MVLSVVSWLTKWTELGPAATRDASAEAAMRIVLKNCILKLLVFSLYKEAEGLLG